MVTTELWPFMPNWREPVDVTLEFKTDVNVSRSGREQRRGLRRTPRRQIKYTVTLDATDMLLFHQLMKSWQSRTWSLPDPARYVRCPDGAPTGSSDLRVSSIPNWLVSGQAVLVGKDVTSVQSVDTAHKILTLSDPITSPALQNASIRPIVTGSFTGQIQASRKSSAATEAVVLLNSTPGTDQIDVSDPSLSICDGREVFLPKPNWKDPVSDTYTWGDEEVDFDFGTIATFNPIQFGTVQRQANFVAQTPDEATKIEQFFARQRGRRGEFLLPTWLNDLPPKVGLDKNANWLRITGLDVYNNYANDPIYKAVAVILKNGIRLYRKIYAITTFSDETGTDTLIQFYGIWLADYALSDIAMISWMPVARFSTDDITIEWLTSDVAQIALSMQSLEYLPAENPISDVDGAAQWVLEMWGEDAGLAILDGLDFIVNIGYPAIFYAPGAWSWLHEDAIDTLHDFIEHYWEVFG